MKSERERENVCKRRDSREKGKRDSVCVKEERERVCKERETGKKERGYGGMMRGEGVSEK